MTKFALMASKFDFNKQDNLRKENGFNEEETTLLDSQTLERMGEYPENIFAVSVFLNKIFYEQEMNFQKNIILLQQIR